jgi:hypothetical protein
MKRSEFEHKVLSLWVSTRVPLTAVNLQLHTGLARDKVLRMLDELVRDQILELDSDDEGEMLWTVPATERPPNGLTRMDEVQRLDRLRAGVAASPRASRALVRSTGAAPLQTAGSDRKSVLASGVLSFFLGPLGWLYAAPLREAAPAVGLYLVAAMLLPHFLLAPLLGILAPLSALAGVVYAWSHNSSGRRTSLREAGREVSARRLLGSKSSD